MNGEEQSDSDRDSVLQQPAGAGAGARGGVLSEGGHTADNSGLRVVSPRDREQSAARLATSLNDAFAECLLSAERRVLDRADRVRASMLDDLERQRANIESLISLFAERLRRQEEGLSSSQEMIARSNQRLEAHADAIRSVSDAQARQANLLSQILEVLVRLGGRAGGPAAAEWDEPVEPHSRQGIGQNSCVSQPAPDPAGNAT
jgi:hypothetical protein